MLITFDIDDTIRLHGSSQPSEQPVVTWAARFFYREPIRIGFIQVCNDLRSQGCQIGIYTTSSRPVGYIRRWMRCYGFRPDLIINAAIHKAAVSARFERGRSPSKHPGLFGVDLHIDDSNGVAVEAERFGFRTLIIDPENLDWGASILDSIRRLSTDQRKSEYCDSHQAPGHFGS